MIVPRVEKPEIEALRRAAEQALNRGDFAMAESRALKLLALTPDDGDALLLAGVAAAGSGRLREAITRLEAAVRAAPGHAEAHAQWARCLSLAGRLAEAERAADQALAIGPRDALSYDTLGVVYSRGNAHVKACAAFRAAIALAPDMAAYQFNLASSLKFLGEFDASEQAYEACLAADPEFWKAHSGLAQLRRQTFESNHTARLLALQPKAQSRLAQVHLHQALAKEFEDLGDDPAAFRNLLAAKAAKRAGYRYSIADDARLFACIEQLFAAPEAAPAPGFNSREPIFVIGLPRSGTTLVERILSSHPDVHSAGELQNFARVIKQVSGTTTREIADPETLRIALQADPRSLGERYLLSTRPATAQCLRFVDKMPMNFLYAGFIARALPNARIVCLRRHPLDTVLSNFRQLFSIDNRYYHYADDLLDCARYYVLFDRLMRHWQRVIPGRILELDYEAIVDAQNTQTQRLLAFCNLEWNDACLQFERNAAPVATASAVQVREPIHRGAVHRWKRYADQLAGVKNELERAGITLD